MRFRFKKINLKCSATAVVVLRVIIGAVFVVSGVAKAIDPWGFIYKIEEYLSAWGMELPRTVLLVGAIGLSAYEFICGAMLALGAYRRRAPQLLMLSMIVMLPLTAYIAIANPVSDCGCFGEFIILSNTATFVKNIIITLCLAYLWKYNSKIAGCLISPPLQWIALLACFGYVLAVALTGYIVQPLVDFRQYETGTQIIADIDENISNADNLKFIYEKNGETAEFTIDALPDSTWTFVSRTESPTPVDTNSSIAIFDSDDEVTDEVLSASGKVLFITIPEPERYDIAYAYHANVLASAVKNEGGETIGLLAASADKIDEWVDLSMAQYECFTVDDTTLKTLVRGPMGAVLINDGVIEWKRSLSSIDFPTIEALSQGKISVDDLAPDTTFFAKLTLWICVIVITLIAATQLFAPIKSLIKKKSVNLHKENQ